MSQQLIDKLNQIKDQLIKWPDELCTGKDGKTLDPDTSFKIIEADLRNTLNKIIMIPEGDRGQLSEVIEEFKQVMTKRQTEAEENLKILKEKVLLNQGTTKAIKAYGNAHKRKNFYENGDLDESVS